MRIDGFIWQPNVLDKLRVKHRVSQDEGEEVFFNRPKYRFVELGYRPDEDVYEARGQPCRAIPGGVLHPQEEPSGPDH